MLFGRADGLVGEEAEQLVADDRPADRAADVVEELGVLLHRAAVAVVVLEGVQARPVGLEERAAAKVVGPVLRDDLHLRAAIAAVLGVVVVGDDLDFLDRVLVRRDDRGAAPGHARHPDAVDLIVVLAGPRAVGDDLSAVLGREDAGRGARSADGRAGQVLGAAVAPRAGPERPRCELQQLEHVASRRRQGLDLLRRSRFPRRSPSRCR